MSKKKKTSTYRDNVVARSEEARTVRKIVAIIIVSILLILLIGLYSGYKYVKSSLEPVDPDNENGIEVEIPMGSTTSSIANLLEENGIIKDARIFRFYIKFKNESDFQAGEYTFTKSMTINQIIASLKEGRIIKEPVHRVTIPEGKTVDQIAEIYANELDYTAKEFLEKVNDTDFIKQLMESYPGILTDDILEKGIRTPLEGYLFAATYDFYEEKPSLESIIEVMLDKTQAVVFDNIDLIEARDLTVHEAITFASLVENEATNEDQRNKISGIFYNRLDEGMRLQTDPTVLYALGGHKEKVLLKDLEIDSPYNTYKIDALPIGPISNFGESALRATVDPEDNDYMYFLHDQEGNIFYAETYDEHLELKKEHIK
ncbi:endolytic transglycosylase MltG [Ornithinibacillus gellani]|uniref:endolytic transglycosylase MltG n=1 Tax=Ornithinibacillus gellani TaxID=2293253 RepID=UPI000F484704|nr:endolytic transglycosylase MltG [Ornithinibacillus gellani]TQS74640.1 endolytic transglycosylase MltG [Ornithinibacillus gellani]